MIEKHRLIVLPPDSGKKCLETNVGIVIPSESIDGDRIGQNMALTLNVDLILQLRPNTKNGQKCTGGCKSGEMCCKTPPELISEVVY